MPHRIASSTTRTAGRPTPAATASTRTESPEESAMAIDPQAQAVLDLVIKSGRPAYNVLSPKEARQLFRETRPASTPTPPEIGVVKNLTADGPAGPIPVRVYRPAGAVATAPLPGLV